MSSVPPTDQDDQRVIAVLGATGSQSRGVIHALLQNTTFLVRAVTLDPSNERARRLLSSEQDAVDKGRLTVVAGSAYDPPTLRAAFDGAYGVFAMTSEQHPHKATLSEDELATDEVEAGRAIVAAVRGTTTVRHFVFSSLPDMHRATGGRFPKLYHMNSKFAIEQIARAELPGKVTCVVPGFFYSNLRWSLYSRLRREEGGDGVVEFCYPIPEGQGVQWTDPEYDMGVYVSKIFTLGPSLTHSKTYLAMSAHITPAEMVETFTRVTGREAVHRPTTADEFGSGAAEFRVGPAFREDATQMMQWAAVAPADKVAYGALEPGESPDGREDLGVRASTFEEYLRRSGWMGPESGE